MKILSFIFFLNFVFNTHSQTKKPEFSKKEHRVFLDDIYTTIEENPTYGIFQLDSIEKRIPKEEINGFKVIKHYFLGIAYRVKMDFDKALFHFETCKDLAEKYNYITYIPEVHRELGDEYTDQEITNKAIEHYDKAIFWYKKLGDDFGVINCTYNGFIERIEGKFEESNTKLKKQLPTFKKVHPIYLDALHTIAQNYIDLKISDSAYYYISKMPLDTLDDINNFNYRLQKHQIYFTYYFDKNKLDSARYFNEKLGENRIREDLVLSYYRNHIQLAKRENDSEKLIVYTDSLDSAYQNYLEDIHKKEIKISEKVISTENTLVETQENKRSQFWFFSFLVFIFLIVVIGLYFYIQKRKRIQKNEIQKMKTQLEETAKVILEIESENETSKLKKIAQKIAEISITYHLSEREASILHHILLGCKNTEIADKLYISVNTVKYHIKKLYDKLDVKKRNEIASKIKI